jgi:hypothetical protein
LLFDLPFGSANVVCRGVSAGGRSDVRHDTLPIATPSLMKEPSIDKSLLREMTSVGEVK